MDLCWLNPECPNQQFLESVLFLILYQTKTSQAHYILMICLSWEFSEGDGAVTLLQSTTTSRVK